MSFASWFWMALALLCMCLLAVSVMVYYVQLQSKNTALKLLQAWKQETLNHERELIQQEMLLQLERWTTEHITQHRQQAIQQSKQISKGQAVEQLLPFWSEFPFHPKDVRFLGSPCDLVVFDGLSDGHLQQIVFVEVKTGQSQLTPREKQIQLCIQQLKVSYQLIRPRY